MSALLIFYGLLGLAAHVAEPPAVSPTHDAAEVEAPAEHTHPAVPAPWGRLADCESGSWDADGHPIPGTARWDYGRPGGFTHEGFAQFHGGLNFHPDTWTWGAEALGHADRFPHAYQAPPHVQIEVGGWVQARQGWGAWPVCSEKLGLR
jgi:hypothetical protein